MATTNKFSDLYAATQPVETQATELMAGIAAMRKQASATMEKLAWGLPAALTGRAGMAAAGAAGALGLGAYATSGSGADEASPNGSGGYNKYRAAQAVDPSTMGQIGRAMWNPLDAIYSSTLGRNDTAQTKVIGRDRNGAPIMGSTQYGQAMLDATRKQMDSVTSGVANGMDDQLAADRMKALRAGINPGQGTLPLTAGQRTLNTYSERAGASRKQPGVAGTAQVGKTRPAFSAYKPVTPPANDNIF